MDARRVVPMTLLAQAGVSVALAALLWAVYGETTAVSALLGGAAAVVPNAFLAARVLKPGNYWSPREMLRSAWIGEIGKILLTVLAFGVIFGAVRPLSAPGVFAGYIAAQLMVFGGLLIGTGGQGEVVTKS
jgi:ATP synthase protein I